MSRRTRDKHKANGKERRYQDRFRTGREQPQVGVRNGILLTQKAAGMVAEMCGHATAGAEIRGTRLLASQDQALALALPVEIVERVAEASGSPAAAIIIIIIS